MFFASDRTGHNIRDAAPAQLSQRATREPPEPSWAPLVSLFLGLVEDPASSIHIAKGSMRNRRYWQGLSV
jgi:hypothetical protein